MGQVPDEEEGTTSLSAFPFFFLFSFFFLFYFFFFLLRKRKFSVICNEVMVIYSS